MRDRGMMRMNLQFFAETSPEGTPAEPASMSLDGLLNQFEQGQGAEPSATPAPAPAVLAEPAQSAQEIPTNEEPPAPADKTNYAFGAMRQQIKQYEDMLSKVAQAAGIEAKDSQELMTKLNDDALSKLAQKQNVPVELLQKIEALEKDSNAWQEQQRKETALIGFQNLTTKFGLSQEELQQFAVELDETGKNPFNMTVDLEKEYIATHYQQVLERQVQAAVQAALKQNSVADQHSSTPNSAQGAAAPTDKVTTLHGLNTWLDQQGLK